MPREKCTFIRIDAVRSGRTDFKGHIRIGDGAWISVIDVVRIATDGSIEVDATTIEGIGNHVRHDMNEDADPYVDVWGFVQILSFIGVRGSQFTEMVGAAIIDDLCDDADQASDLKKAVERVVDKNEDDEEVYYWRSKDEIAARTRCECCEAGPWETRAEMLQHFKGTEHIAKALAEEQQRIQQEREGVEGCALCNRERFRSEGARAAHLLTKGHLDAAERAERREQRRLGHRVQGRTREAQAAREDRPAMLRMEDYAVEGTEGSDRPQLHRVGRAFPKRQVCTPTPPSSEPVSEAHEDLVLTSRIAPSEAAISATQEDAVAVIEPAPGPSERATIVADTATRSIDRAGEVDGYSDVPEDDFVTYLLSRFSEPQKRMFAESYGVYMREDMRNSFCIDLDQAFEWMGFTRKDTAVAHVKKHLQPGDYKTVQDNPPTLTGASRSFQKVVKYFLTPRAFKKVLMRARGNGPSPMALTPEAALPTATCSHIPRQTAPLTTKELADLVSEAPTEESIAQDAPDTVPQVSNSSALGNSAPVREPEAGPSERVTIVAETSARAIYRPDEIEGESDTTRDDFVTYLLSRFSEPQKRMFAESYGVYVREDLRNKFCIDLDQAFEWLGYAQKGKAVALVISILKDNVDYVLSRSGKNTSASVTVGRRPDKYMLTPRGFKKLLMRARTTQGDAATDYFLEIEDALLAYNSLKRTNRGVSQFDSSAKARRNGLRLRSVTDSIDTHVSGLYFGVPERTWDMLRPLNPSFSPSLLAVDRSEMTVIKFGMKRGDTDRTEQHCTTFQGFYLLDHVPTEHMAEVEDLLKAWLRNEGLLFEGLHENRRSRDTELTVVVTQAEYVRVVERTLLLIKQTDDKKRRSLGVGECAREEEARAEQEKAKAVQMTETTAQLAIRARMAELELVKLGLLPAQALSACQLSATCTSS